MEESSTLMSSNPTTPIILQDAQADCSDVMDEHNIENIHGESRLQDGHSCHVSPVVVERCRGNESPQLGKT